MTYSVNHYCVACGDPLPPDRFRYCSTSCYLADEPEPPEPEDEDA